MKLKCTFLDSDKVIKLPSQLKHLLPLNPIMCILCHAWFLLQRAWHVKIPCCKFPSDMCDSQVSWSWILNQFCCCWRTKTQFNTIGMFVRSYIFCCYKVSFSWKILQVFFFASCNVGIRVFYLRARVTKKGFILYPHFVCISRYFFLTKICLHDIAYNQQWQLLSMFTSLASTVFRHFISQFKTELNLKTLRYPSTS